MIERLHEGTPSKTDQDKIGVHIIDAKGRLVKEADTDLSPLFMCPKCQCYTGCNIPNPKYVDTFFFWFSLKRFECHFCGHKFYERIK